MRLRLITGSVVAAVLVGLIASATLGAQTAPAKTATQVYMDFRAAWAKAKSIDELLPYFSAAKVKDIKATPAADRPKMFEFLKMVDTMTDIKVTKEDRTSAGATLTAEGIDSDTKAKKTGKIDMVREGGVFKVGQETW